MTQPLINVVVAAAKTLAEGIVGFELQRADAGSLPAFTAGAHLDVMLPGDVIRQYSLCNDPSETHRYCLGVLKESDGRGGSAAMHELKRVQNYKSAHHVIILSLNPTRKRRCSWREVSALRLYWVWRTPCMPGVKTLNCITARATKVVWRFENSWKTHPIQTGCSSISTTGPKPRNLIWTCWPKRPRSGHISMSVDQQGSWMPF